MFNFAGDLPAQVINWHDRHTESDLSQGKTLFSGAVCGGLSQQEHLHWGTPTTIREAAREAMHMTNSRRFMLSSGCVAFVTTPLSNLRAVREAVEGT